MEREKLLEHGESYSCRKGPPGRRCGFGRRTQLSKPEPSKREPRGDKYSGLSFPSFTSLVNLLVRLNWNPQAKGPIDANVQVTLPGKKSVWRGGLEGQTRTAIRMIYCLSRAPRLNDSGLNLHFPITFAVVVLYCILYIATVF